MRIKLVKPKGSRYGWLPDHPDPRDFPFRELPKAVRKLPRMVDLRPGCSPVEDQSSLGSCTANAIVGAMEHESRQHGSEADYSRLFLYYNERVMIGTVNEDSGAYIRDGMKSAANDGVCLEKDWPYNIAKFAKRPCAGQYADALDHQVLTYHRLDNRLIQELKQCLAEGYPFVFGFTVFDSFESQEVALTGMVPFPADNESRLGGHAVLCVGYDDSMNRFIVRNSWGYGWGKAGYCFMPYNYLTNPMLSDDFWTLRTMEV